MAEIRTFCAVHPAEGLASKLAALPYDVYSRDEAREQVKKAPESFLAIDRPETQFPKDQDMYAPEVYQKAHDMLEEWIKRGSFVQDQQKCYYLYELTMDGRSQTGLVACASIDDYLNGVIKKHENTRAEKEQDRIRHVDTCNAQTGPIFLAYRKDQTIAEVTAKIKQQKPMFAFVSEDGIGHKGWSVDAKEDIAIIADTFAKIDKIYIADGHHRAASAVKVGQLRRKQHPDYDGSEEFNYFLSVLFPDEELYVMDYNRVVLDLNGQTREGFLENATKIFDVQPVNAAYHPQKKGTFGMYLSGQWYHLTAKAELTKDDPVEGLDVAYLQREFLQPYLDIQDPKTSKRIRYVGGIRGLSELERMVDHVKETQQKDAVAFSMYPTSMAELFAVADAGMLMPPKSTWFEPKLRSGLFLHML